MSTPSIDRILRLSGTDAYNHTADKNFLMIGERTNVAGSPRFAKLVRSNDLEKAVDVARQQVENGANVIDICFDDGLIDGVEMMGKFLRLLQAEPDVAAVPIMVDSSKWEILEEGLKYLQGKGIVNSISLKEGEENFLRQAKIIKRYGAAVVVMAFDEQGQAATYEEKIRICKRAYDLLMTVDFPPEDIIFDPNILTIFTGIESIIPTEPTSSMPRVGSRRTSLTPRSVEASLISHSPSEEITSCARPFTPSSSTMR